MDSTAGYTGSSPDSFANDQIGCSLSELHQAPSKLNQRHSNDTPNQINIAATTSRLFQIICTPMVCDGSVIALNSVYPETHTIQSPLGRGGGANQIECHKNGTFSKGDG